MTSASCFGRGRIYFGLLLGGQIIFYVMRRADDIRPYNRIYLVFRNAEPYVSSYAAIFEERVGADTIRPLYTQ
jgi:hypothetical protein